MTTQEQYDIDAQEGTEHPHPEFTDPKGSGMGTVWLIGAVAIWFLVFFVAFCQGWRP